MTPEARSHLVVDGRARPLTIVLDGYSLTLLAKQEEVHRHPMRRIDRVTLRGEVWIHSSALHGLSAAGIPLGLLDPDARLAGVFLPRVQRKSSFADTLQRIATRPDLMDRLEDWRRAEASIHARALRLDDPAAEARAGWQTPEALLSAAALLSGRRARMFLAAARSQTELAATRALLDAGCPARWLGEDPDPMCNLVPLFAQLLLWRLVRRASTRRGGQDLRRALTLDGTSTGRALARLTENALRAPARSLSADIHRFHLHLIEIKNTHRDNLIGGRPNGVAHRL